MKASKLNTSMENIVFLVTDKGHPRQGELCKLLCFDIHNKGTHSVIFADGSTSTFPEGRIEMYYLKKDVFLGDERYVDKLIKDYLTFGSLEELKDNYEKLFKRVFKY